LCGAETWILRKVDQKYLESSEMCFWKRMEKNLRKNYENATFGAYICVALGRGYLEK
jgi:hypothetical protein